MSWEEQRAKLAQGRIAAQPLTEAQRQERLAQAVEADRKRQAEQDARAAELLASRPTFIPPKGILLPVPAPVVLNPRNVVARDISLPDPNAPAPTLKKAKASDSGSEDSCYVTWPKGRETFSTRREAIDFASQIQDKWLPVSETGDPMHGFFSVRHPVNRSTLVRVWIKKFKVTRKGERVFLGFRPHFPDGVESPMAEGAERNTLKPIKPFDGEILSIVWLVCLDNGATQKVERLRPKPGKKFREELAKQGQELVLRFHVGAANDSGRVNCTCVRAICPLPEEEGGDVEVTGDMVVDRTAILKSGVTIEKPDQRRAPGKAPPVCKRSAAEKMRNFSLPKR